MAIYSDKVKESFETKLKIFLFTKAFDGSIPNYYIKEEPRIIKEEFCEFVLTEEVANVYSAQYYQFLEDEIITLNGKSMKSKDIVNNLGGATKYIFTRNNLKNCLNNLYDELKEEYKLKSKMLSKTQFKELVKNETCEYCGITKEEIALLGKEGKLHNKRSETRGYTLEIDRKYPNLEYTKDNCCMSCYWCNNAKTDEFLPQEFKEVARGINAIWKCRGANVPKFDDIEFWKTYKDSCYEDN